MGIGIKGFKEGLIYFLFEKNIKNDIKRLKKSLLFFFLGKKNLKIMIQGSKKCLLLFKKKKGFMFFKLFFEI